MQQMVFVKFLLDLCCDIRSQYLETGIGAERFDAIRKDGALRAIKEAACHGPVISGKGTRPAPSTKYSITASSSVPSRSLSHPVTTAMHQPTLISMILIVAARLCHAQGNLTTPDSNDPDHWCGQWAGQPNPDQAPSLQLLPPRNDYTKRFFVEPQLQRTPFSPIMADEPKVQIPKFWGTSTSLSSRLLFLACFLNIDNPVPFLIGTFCSPFLPPCSQMNSESHS